MRVSAIVPATDRPATLRRVLAAIDSELDGPDEVIVVDELAQPGPAAARNTGAARASGDILVFVDSDVEVHAGTFGQIRRAFSSDPSLTAVFGSYDDDPESLALVSSFRNLLHHHVHQRASGPTSSFWAALGAIRREEFLACGGFDARRYRVSSVEDVELGMRLAKRGARVVLDPDLQGKHLKHWSVRTMVRTDLIRRGAPWSELLLRERRILPALSLSWHSQASAGATAWLAWALGRRRAASSCAAVALIVSVNFELYRLLVRRRGLRMAIAGPCLHVLYNAIALWSLPVGVARFLLNGRSDLILRRLPWPTRRLR